MFNKKVLKNPKTINIMNFPPTFWHRVYFPTAFLGQEIATFFLETKNIFKNETNMKTTCKFVITKKKEYIRCLIDI